ncbi:hypothetical protein BJX63DRAFT_439395 [Aspergillus granulosus]|uniref:Caspase domain-containing protein n=1 Tax=Aspergillus granulosus TaxID=176169 RepID=A0ABR4GZ51_9EURO
MDTTNGFKEILKAAVQQRSIRYTATSGLSLRWEDDDTLAINDTVQFQNILGLLNLPAAEEIIISRDDTTPGWTVLDSFRQVLSRAKNVSGRALIVVHYAGHGRVDSDGSLLFVERPGGREIDADRSLFSLVGNYGHSFIRNIEHIDVLFILDCCYGFVAYRDAETCPRIVEIISATTENDPLAFSPPKVTITKKLAAEITRRKRDGYQYIEIADVVATIREKHSPAKKPGHCLKLGATSICLPFTGLVRINPAHIRPSLRAVFSVHLTEDMTPNEINQLLNWVRTLPEFASITLDGVYHTGSTCLVLSSAWSVWSKVSGMRGFGLVTEATGPNALGQPHKASEPTKMPERSALKPKGTFFESMDMRKMKERMGEMMGNLSLSK